MEGWLLKLGEKGLLNLKRKRWFVLDPSLLRLRYFKERNGVELGFINLADALKVEENWRLNPKDLTGFVVRFYSVFSLFHGLSDSCLFHHISIVTRDRRWKLEAESVEQREAWVRGIVQCLPSSQLKRRMDAESANRVNRLRAVSSPAAPMDMNGDSAGGVMFEFEEELDTPSASGNSPSDRYISDTDDDELMDDEIDPSASSSSTTATTHAAAAPPATPATASMSTGAGRITASQQQKLDNASARMMATSVPVSIPQRLAQTWHERGFMNWSSDEEDDDVPDDFEKPHEVVAKTYQEHYMKTGDLQFDVPISESRKIKALI